MSDTYRDNGAPHQPVITPPSGGGGGGGGGGAEGVRDMKHKGREAAPDKDLQDTEELWRDTTHGSYRVYFFHSNPSEIKRGER